MTDRSQMDTAVLFDRDSTLGDTRHRWHLSPMKDPRSSWAVYAAACEDDPPIIGAVAAARLHYPHHRIHICSGMDGSGERANRRWLDKLDIPYDEVRLRPAGDTEIPNADLKVNYIYELWDRHITVVLCYEDWGPAAEEIYRRTGVPVVGVNPFYPEDTAKFQQQVHDNAGGGL
jgi:hypothetical protein